MCLCYKINRLFASSLENTNRDYIVKYYLNSFLQYFVLYIIKNVSCPNIFFLKVN